MARLGLQWSRAAWIALAASCAFGAAACSDEDQPDNNTTDAATDTSSDKRTDVSVGTDVSNDTSVSDRRDTGSTVDAGSDRTDGGAPDGTNNCVGGGDAARDGASGMLAVQTLRCANCHQDEPVDAGLILSGKLSTIVADATVFPANLTPDPTTGLGCWTDQQIITAIMDGLDDEGKTLCSRMPLFKNQIDAGTAQEIVNFLRTLPAVKKVIPETTVCPPRPEPQPDGGGGSDADAGAPTDGGTDGSAPDVGPDSTTSPDASDATSPDAGQDGGVDVGIDVGIDVGLDTGSPDTGTDVAADNENG